MRPRTGATPTPLQPLETLTATQAAAGLERGEMSCEALVRACLDRIEAREPTIHAWVVVDRPNALARARELDRMPRRSALHGIPIAVKDIIATHDLSTRYGSPIYANHVAPADAACVTLLKRAGAIIAGKTVTTELAYFHPGPTVNPRNFAHTPGGSSSGSAAAVADCMVAIGLGTQTAGSVTRPASFCGVVGFKPTFGRINMTGVKPFAPSLDTLGWMARSVEDIELMRSALVGVAYQPLPQPQRRMRIGVYRTGEWDSAEPESQRAVENAAAMLRTCADVSDIGIRESMTGLVDVQKTVMAYEAAQSLAYEHDVHRNALSESLRALIERGTGISYDDYVAALHRAAMARHDLRSLLDDVDVLLTPSAIGEAPAGLDSTGDPLFSRVWTLLGVPSVTIPTHQGPKGLPVGVQLIGAWDDDRRLLAIAAWINERIGTASQYR